MAEQAVSAPRPTCRPSRPRAHSSIRRSSRRPSTRRLILAFLTARGIPFKSYFISNMVLTQGNLALVNGLAAHGDVARVEANTAHQMVLPKPEEATSRRAGPQTIEPGLTRIKAPDVWGMGFHGEGRASSETPTPACSEITRQSRTSIAAGMARRRITTTTGTMAPAPPRPSSRPATTASGRMYPPTPTAMAPTPRARWSAMMAGPTR